MKLTFYQSYIFTANEFSMDQL
uniref:Uncharacterized protein n=1 Tax=Rhizophora mucronata TaxID=61149 RepID=A0A2P2JG99_RHIMU